MITRGSIGWILVTAAGMVAGCNSDTSGTLIREIEARVAAAYNWDSLDKAVPR